MLEITGDFQSFGDWLTRGNVRWLNAVSTAARKINTASISGTATTDSQVSDDTFRVVVDDKPNPDEVFVCSITDWYNDSNNKYLAGVYVGKIQQGHAMNLTVPPNTLTDGHKCIILNVAEMTPLWWSLSDTNLSNLSTHDFIVGKVMGKFIDPSSTDFCWLVWVDRVIPSIGYGKVTGIFNNDGSTWSASSYATGTVPWQFPQYATCDTCWSNGANDDLNRNVNIQLANSQTGDLMGFPFIAEDDIIAFTRSDRLESSTGGSGTPPAPPITYDGCILWVDGLQGKMPYLMKPLDAASKDYYLYWDHTKTSASEIVWKRSWSVKGDDNHDVISAIPNDADGNPWLLVGSDGVYIDIYLDRAANIYHVCHVNNASAVSGNNLAGLSKVTVTTAGGVNTLHISQPNIQRDTAKHVQGITTETATDVTIPAAFTLPSGTDGQLLGNVGGTWQAVPGYTGDEIWIHVDTTTHVISDKGGNPADTHYTELSGSLGSYYNGSGFTTCCGLWFDSKGRLAQIQDGTGAWHNTPPF
jgi:hypothetical protein